MLPEHLNSNSTLLQHLEPQWVALFDTINREWMEAVQLVLDYFCERTPRSFVETRETSLVWNYKYAGVGKCGLGEGKRMTWWMQREGGQAWPRYLRYASVDDVFVRSDYALIQCCCLVMRPDVLMLQTLSLGASRRETCCSTCGQAQSATHPSKSSR